MVVVVVIQSGVAILIGNVRNKASKASYLSCSEKMTHFKGMFDHCVNKAEGIFTVVILTAEFCTVFLLTVGILIVGNCTVVLGGICTAGILTIGNCTVVLGGICTAGIYTIGLCTVGLLIVGHLTAGIYTIHVKRFKY